MTDPDPSLERKAALAMFTGVIALTFVGTILLSYAWIARPARMVHPF
jgi:hypothetical protein